MPFVTAAAARQRMAERLKQQLVPSNPSCASAVQHETFKTLQTTNWALNATERLSKLASSPLAPLILSTSQNAAAPLVTTTKTIKNGRGRIHLIVTGTHTHRLATTPLCAVDVTTCTLLTRIVPLLPTFPHASQMFCVCGLYSPRDRGHP